MIHKENKHLWEVYIGDLPTNFEEFSRGSTITLFPQNMVIVLF